MSWKFDDKIPIYTQIVTRIKVRIANGTYGNNTKLPAVRELALEAGVNPNTVQKAFSELERDGLLYTERTSGRFVTDDETMLKKLKETLCNEYIRDLFQSLDELGIEHSEILQMIQNYIKEVGHDNDSKM